MAGILGYGIGMGATALATARFVEMGGHGLSAGYGLAGWALLLAMAVGLTASAYPALSAARLDPNDARLEIERGDFLCIMGESGAGKSTVLSILGAMNAPTSGRLEVDGIDVYALDSERRADFRREFLGFVFQSFQISLHNSDVIKLNTCQINEPTPAPPRTPVTTLRKLFEVTPHHCCKDQSTPIIAVIPKHIEYEGNAFIMNNTNAEIWPTYVPIHLAQTGIVLPLKVRQRSAIP